jgi:hypothetical protein
MDAEAYEGLDARLDAVEALLAGVLVALFDGRVLPARAIIAKLEDAEEHLRQRNAHEEAILVYRRLREVLLDNLENRGGAERWVD